MKKKRRRREEKKSFIKTISGAYYVYTGAKKKFIAFLTQSQEKEEKIYCVSLRHDS